MPQTLRFVFKEGFANDDVVIRIEGQEVARRGGISTRHDVEPPMAWSVDVPVAADVVTTEVAVPTKNATGSLQVRVAQSPQVDVTVQGNSVVLRGSAIVPSIG